MDGHPLLFALPMQSDFRFLDLPTRLVKLNEMFSCANNENALFSSHTQRTDYSYFICLFIYYYYLFIFRILLKDFHYIAVE